MDVNMKTLCFSVEKLETFGNEEEGLSALKDIRNQVTGSNHQKSESILLGIIPKLVGFLFDQNFSINLKIECIRILCCLAYGDEYHVKPLIDNGVVDLVLQGINSSNHTYSLECLRTLCAMLKSPLVPSSVIYNSGSLIPLLLVKARESQNSMEYVGNILASCCTTNEHQMELCSSGTVPVLVSLLNTSIPHLQMPALKCLAAMAFQNEQVSQAIVTTSYEGFSMNQMLVSLLARNKPFAMQLLAAKTLTYIFRAGALNSYCNRDVLLRVLHCLVRLCKKDQPSSIRAEAADVLAYLMETDTELQRIGSYCDHLVPCLAEFLKAPGLAADGAANDFKLLQKAEQEAAAAQDMRTAAFKAFASLGANEEDIRRKVIETDDLMEHVVKALSDQDINIRLAAVRCLHSLSRSVQQLRTSFQDHAVWKPLMKILQNANDDVLTVASSTLCNLLLEFSPSKEPILESGAVEMLCDLTMKRNPALRLNGVWALMNMAFQADQKVKDQILSGLGEKQLFMLLNDPEPDVLMKTLGLLRNLLSTKPHIDHIMAMFGQQIMQSVLNILDHQNQDLQEQGLCILANIADGDTAKEYIMTNDEVIQRLMHFMMHADIKLQVAATFCICNLVWMSENGSDARQTKLRDMGVEKILSQLITVSEPALFDKVKTALQQFT